MRSSVGVRTRGCPAAPYESPRNWSSVMKSTFTARHSPRSGACARRDRRRSRRAHAPLRGECLAVNVLFITLDQFRGDSYGAAGHPLVRTPTLDRIASEGVRLERHYSQSAPCAPGRAALYTGTYLMNNRVVANGTPLPSGLDNIAKVARRAGYDPTLFGYTDQGLDPNLSLIHISEPTRQAEISYAVFCLKKKKKT